MRNGISDHDTNAPEEAAPDCTTCEGGGWVTDGDDRLVRCECSERES